MATRTKSTTARRSTSKASKGRTRTTKVARRSRKVAAPVTGDTITYPFTTKAQIAARINSDASEAFSALATINSLDAAMSSQKKLVRDLCTEVSEAGKGAADNKDLVSRVTAVALRYTRRLAKHERALALKANPDLKPFVKMFSATAG